MLFHAGGESAGGIKVVRGAAAMAGVVVKVGESARPETHVPAVLSVQSIGREGTSSPGYVSWHGRTGITVGVGVGLEVIHEDL
jgi:hypothetical protein